MVSKWPKGNYKIQNREIRFEVTNRCNARCIMCPRDKMTRPQGVLDLGLFMRALDEANNYGADVVSLENYGETFLDPLFFERASYAKGKGMEVYTITNGSLFDKTVAQRSVYLLDKIRFSVYGTTREVFESIHLGIDYETVISNIEFLIEEKKRRNSPLPKIEMYFLVMDENKHQAEEFKDRWMCKVDDVAIWKPHNWSDGRNYRALNNGEKKVTCGRPAVGPVQVQWDGLVVPCCFDYNSNIVLGDLKKQSLYEILTGPAYNEFREAHNQRKFELYPFCNSCDQLIKREDVLVFSTNQKAKVGSVNTTFEKVR